MGSLESETVVQQGVPASGLKPHSHEEEVSQAITQPRWPRALPAAWRGVHRPPTALGMPGTASAQLPHVFQTPLEGQLSLRGRCLGVHLFLSFLSLSPASSAPLSPLLVFTLYFSYSLCTRDDALHRSHLHRFQTF